MTPKKQRRRSMRQERELANAASAKQQPGSGALPGRKGDVHKRGVFRAECKYTKKKSYSVKRSELNKISSECSFGEVPVLDIAFLGSSGQTEDRWVVVPYSSWLAEVPQAPTTGVISYSNGDFVRWRNGAPEACEHANENPVFCGCPPDCYCQTHTCKTKTPL